jgi:hypothetical protein
MAAHSSSCINRHDSSRATSAGVSIDLPPIALAFVLYRRRWSGELMSTPRGCGRRCCSYRHGAAAATAAADPDPVPAAAAAARGRLA